jgi:hypothetical protein
MTTKSHDKSTGEFVILSRQEFEDLVQLIREIH